MPRTLLLLLAASLAACSADAPTDADDATAPGIEAGLHHGPIRVVGQVLEARSDLPVARARVCSLDAEHECVIADADGLFELDAWPTDIQGVSDVLVLSTWKQGFERTLQVRRSDGRDVDLDLRAVRQHDLEQASQRLGFKIHPDAGHVVVSAESVYLGKEGLEISSDADSGGVYSDSDAPAARRNPVTETVVAVEYNVEPGVVTYRVSDDDGGRYCVPEAGLPGEDADQVRVPVLAGAVSWVELLCL